MVSKVYAEPATGEPRPSRTLGASATMKWPAGGGAASLVCDGTFALRRGVWLARNASPARARRVRLPLRV